MTPLPPIYHDAPEPPRRLPCCVNCGDPLGPSSLYCDDCLEREGESWFHWRARLARKRNAMISNGYPVPPPL